jgi:hypothetical protein
VGLDSLQVDRKPYSIPKWSTGEFLESSLESGDFLGFRYTYGKSYGSLSDNLLSLTHSESGQAQPLPDKKFHWGLDYQVFKLAKRPHLAAVLFPGDSSVLQLAVWDIAQSDFHLIPILEKYGQYNSFIVSEVDGIPYANVSINKGVFRAPPDKNFERHNYLELINLKTGGRQEIPVPDDVVYPTFIQGSAYSAGGSTYQLLKGKTLKRSRAEAPVLVQNLNTGAIRVIRYDRTKLDGEETFSSILGNPVGFEFAGKPFVAFHLQIGPVSKGSNSRMLPSAPEFAPYYEVVFANVESGETYRSPVPYPLLGDPAIFQGPDAKYYLAEMVWENGVRFWVREIKDTGTVNRHE